MGIIPLASRSPAGGDQGQVDTFCKVCLIRGESFVDSSLDFIRRTTVTEPVSVEPCGVSALEHHFDAVISGANM